MVRRAASLAAVFAMVAAGCGAAPVNELRMGARAGGTLEVINESSETICYVLLTQGPDPAREPGHDHLDPAETLRPGEQRPLALEPGAWHLTLRDCADNDMLVRELEVDEAGVALVFRGRES